jgi:hypothetical protein
MCARIEHHFPRRGEVAVKVPRAVDELQPPDMAE